MNVHLHGLFVDGVFTCDSVRTRARFQPLPAPTDAEVALVTEQIARRVLRLLRREGHVADPDAPADAGVDDELSPLDACQAAAVQGRIALGLEAGHAVRRLGRQRDVKPEFRRGALCAEVQGFSLHAATAVAAGRPDELERLQPNYAIFRTQTVAFDCDDHARRASVARRDGWRTAYLRQQRGLCRA